MKKTVALFILGMIFFTAFTQESKSKFAIGAIISANMSYRTLTPEKDYPYPGLVDAVNDIEAPKFGYSVGFTVFYSVHKKIKLQSGVGFSDNGYRTKKQEPLRFGNQWDGTGFNPSLLSGENITAAAFTENYYYVDIPLQVKYNFFLKKKIEFYVTGGVEANFNVASQHVFIKWDENGNKEKEKYDYPFNGFEVRKFNFSTLAGIGMDIHLCSRVALFVQPTFRYMVLPIMDTPFKKRLYSAGLSMGVNIGL